MKTFQIFLRENESRDPGGKLMKMIDWGFKYDSSKASMVTEHRREGIITSCVSWLKF